jgi:hypothetical protein
VPALGSVTALAVHAADPRGLRPVHPVEHRRQRQKTPALARVLRRRGKPPKLTGREIPPNAHRCWHGANPPRAMESAQPEIRNTRESQTMAPGYNGRDWSAEFSGITAALKAWKLKSFVLDGEACACDEKGR